MADAPTGGSGWTAVEIIVVIILVIALLSQLTGKKITPVISPNSSTQTTTPAADTDAAIPACGITIERPKPLESVKGFVTLIGNTTGCGWEVKNAVALYAQVVDSRGKPVSVYTPIPATLIDANGLATFSSTIRLTAVPNAGTGTLILVPTVPAPSETQQTLRIPIQFK
jgi:hypothetical protein